MGRETRMYMQLGKFSSADLALFLSLFPILFKEEQEARDLLKEKADRILAPDIPPPMWCHLYEIPAREHFLGCMLGLGLQDDLKQLAQSPNQAETLADIAASLHEDDEWEPTDEERESGRKLSGQLFAAMTSTLNSLPVHEAKSC